MTSVIEINFGYNNGYMPAPVNVAFANKEDRNKFMVELALSSIRMIEAITEEEGITIEEAVSGIRDGSIDIDISEWEIEELDGKVSIFPGMLVDYISELKLMTYTIKEEDGKSKKKNECIKQETSAAV